QIARDDPRKLIHSLKVGLALTIVSLFYYFKPFYRNFGVSSIWAVITVVVIFEYSVGATLGKGLNKGLATLTAGGLGLGAHHLAVLAGQIGEPLVIAAFVFLHAVASTYARFFPQVKARYDYGFLMFILTFCLISISGFRTDQVLILAQNRLCTILVGASVCLVVSIFICPVWAGEELQKLIAKNIEKIGNSLEGSSIEMNPNTKKTLQIPNSFIHVSEIAGTLASESESSKLSSESLNTILSDSKTMEENLANFAKWEPGHGSFRFYHPWKQYLKIGQCARQCGSTIDTLIGSLNSITKQEISIPDAIREEFSCTGCEAGKALKGMSWTIETMTRPSSPDIHMENMKTAAKTMKTLLKSNTLEDIKYGNLLQLAPLATIASLLIDTVNSIETISEAVNELGVLANFR
ncbi:hypothetical protein M569_06608, partial [Genlisea aurea]